MDSSTNGTATRYDVLKERIDTLAERFSEHLEESTRRHGEGAARDSEIVKVLTDIRLSVAGILAGKRLGLWLVPLIMAGFGAGITYLVKWTVADEIKTSIAEIRRTSP